jgi:hypothetical protein
MDSSQLDISIEKDFSLNIHGALFWSLCREHCKMQACLNS